MTTTLRDRRERAAWAVLALSLALAAPARAGLDEKDLARRFAKAASRAGVERVAVLPFDAVDGSDAREGRHLAERLTGRLAECRTVTVVERSLLDHVMRENYLGQTGALGVSGLARLGRLLQAQAVVVGAFVGSGPSVSLEVRLVEIETGAVLSAGEARLRREAFGPAAGLFSPSVAITGESVAAELAAFARGEEPARDAVASGGAYGADDGMPDCLDASRRADHLQRQVLELKARYWAAQASRPGFSASSVRVKPGSTITDPDLRARFFELMRRYAARPAAPLTEAEVRRFVAADGDAFRLLASCGQLGL